MPETAELDAVRGSDTNHTKDREHDQDVVDHHNAVASHVRRAIGLAPKLSTISTSPTSTPRSH